MRVLVGSHGTGKTTLLRNLSKHCPEFYITDGFSRPVKRACKNLSLSSFSEEVIINELARWQWMSGIDQLNLFCARSIIDTHTYAKAFKRPGIAHETLKCFLNSDYRKVKYYYIPIEFPLEQDGVRYEDEEFQRKIDEELVSFIYNFNLDITVIKGSIEERTNLIINNL